MLAAVENALDTRAPEPAARGKWPRPSRTRRPDHRSQRADPGTVPRHRPRGSDRRDRADPRRVRNRQGAGRDRHPPAQPAREPPHGHVQLRRRAGDAARERVVRPRARRVHRRGVPQGGAVRPGRRRRPAGRDRRRPLGSRPRSCACSRNGRSNASAARDRARGRAHPSRHPPRPGARDRRWSVPRRPLPSAERGHAVRPPLRSTAVPALPRRSWRDSPRAGRRDPDSRRTPSAAVAPWPGNVRELEHCLRRVLIFARLRDQRDDIVRHGLARRRGPPPGEKAKILDQNAGRGCQPRFTETVGGNCC